MAKKSKVDDEHGEEGLSEDGHTPIRLRDHPRAVRSIARARAWGALVGFAVAAWVGNRASLPFVDLVLRAILIGLATSVVVWAGAIALWRQIVFAEIAVRRKEALEKQQELVDAIEHPEGDTQR